MEKSSVQNCFLFGALAREERRDQCIFFFLCPVLKSFLREKRGEGEEDERIGLPNGAGSVG